MSTALQSNPKTVAIIGGGIAGLSCAKALERDGGFAPTVFDTGRLRPGGRCSSRFPGDEPKDSDPDMQHHNYRYLNQVPIDHAAQILTVPEGMPEFAKQVKEWEKGGVLKEFPVGSVCSIFNPYDRKTRKYDKTQVRVKPLQGKNRNNNGNSSLVKDSSSSPVAKHYYGVNGMGVIPQSMAKGIEVCQDVWVSPSGGVRYRGDSASKSQQPWQVLGSNKKEVLGNFDHLVVAHNGKCADRLMSRTPAKDLHWLLRVNFAPFVPKDGGKKMTLNSIYSLTFALRGPSVLSEAVKRYESRFISGFVKNHPSLRFLSWNSRKHRSEDGSEDDGVRSDVEVWTVLSSAKFGKQHKGPQEFLPTELQDKVTGLLLEAIEESLLLPKGSLCGETDDTDSANQNPSAVLESRLQLWGAAVPVNVWKPDEDGPHGYLYDQEHAVGACGDWLLDASIAGAWESGRRLAEHMMTTEPSTAGLSGKFEASQAVDRAGIGALQQ